MTIQTTIGELIELGVWGDLCGLRGNDPYVVAEGRADEDTEVTLTKEEAVKIGIIGYGEY